MGGFRRNNSGIVLVDKRYFFEIAPQHVSSFAYALFTFLSGRLKVPREDEDNAHAKLFACVSTQISSFYF